MYRGRGRGTVTGYMEVCVSTPLAHAEPNGITQGGIQADTRRVAWHSYRFYLY